MAHFFQDTEYMYAPWIGSDTQPMKFIWPILVCEAFTHPHYMYVSRNWLWHPVDEVNLADTGSEIQLQADYPGNLSSYYMDITLIISGTTSWYQV